MNKTKEKRLRKEAWEAQKLRWGQKMNAFPYLVFSMLVTLANIVVITIEIDNPIPMDESRGVFLYLDWIFIGFYSAEVLARYYLLGNSMTKNKWWVLDVVLIAIALVELLFQDGPMRLLRWVPSLRILRLVRFIRFVRLVHYLQELHLIYLSFGDCFLTLSWVVIILLGLCWTGGIFCYVIMGETKVEEKFP